MEEKYYLVIIEDSYDTGFGTSEPITTHEVISSKSELFPIYQKYPMEEISKEEYDRFNEEG